MEIKIYSDIQLASNVETGILFEGQTYFADFTDYSPTQRQEVVATARLTKFGSQQFQNTIWEFKIEGFVGFIELNGIRWDVRSRKLDLDGSGDQQFQSLLEEIESSLGNYTFRYSTPSAAKVTPNAKWLADDQLRLEYLQSFLLMDSDLKSISGLYDILYRRPHNVLQKKSGYVKAGKPGRIDRKAFSKNLSKSGLVRLNESSAQNGLAINGWNYGVSQVPIRKTHTNFDTSENRFVKFVLKDFEALCVRVRDSINSKPNIREDATSLLIHIRKHLSEPILRTVSPLTFFPSHSSVLTRDFVYAGIYEHFMRSKYGTSHSLHEFNNQLRFSALKDVASLYEIWCFAQVANAVFETGDTIYIDHFDRNRSKFSNGCCWRTEHGALYFNKSFGSQTGSYSITLRPDIVLEKLIGNEKHYWHFDAKYKVKVTTDDSGTAHAGDLHKMHTYVDAISGSVSSIALYPGTEMRMYPRQRAEEQIEFLSVLDSGGVGAIGLVPGRGQDIIQSAINKVLEITDTV